MSDDLESRRIAAEDARQFLRSSQFKAMFSGVSDYLEQKALSCDTKDHERAADILRCKQLLAQMKREIERSIEDGDIAAFHIGEIERKRGLARVFQR